MKKTQNTSAVTVESIGSATLDNVGTRIKAAREVIGMTRAQLSRATGLTQSALHQLENGDSKGVAGENVFPIADALKISARWLLTGVDAIPVDGVEMQMSHDIRTLAMHLSTLDQDRVNAAMTLFGLRSVHYNHGKV